MGRKIAYQGVIGSFSSIAARALYGLDIVPIHTVRFREIFDAVSSGGAEAGVVPIENALAGSIHENYDLLAEYECSIVGEYYCPVQLHLMTAPSGTQSISEITRVLSHPKALEQCSIFLEQHPSISPVMCSDTAGAALQVKREEAPSSAAIASEEAASEFGLTIVARSIQNHPHNMTRFIAIGTTPYSGGNATKCSLILTLPHRPASLYTLLGEFAALEINVTKIESRPIAGKPFEYSFHIDIELTPTSKATLPEAVERAKHASAELRVLGIYPAQALR